MALLDVRGVSKNFGAIRALTDVSFTVEPGEVVGLMGDNGAGKSTMVKLIAGNFPPSEGEIAVDGEIVPFPQADRGARQGHRGRLSGPGAVPTISPPRKTSFSAARSTRASGPFSVLDKRGDDRPRRPSCSSELKSETRPRDLVRQMSGGQRQAVAIARTRLSNAKLVLMDEPTAAISVRQVAEVLELIRRLQARKAWRSC